MDVRGRTCLGGQKLAGDALESWRPPGGVGGKVFRLKQPTVYQA